MLRLDKEIILGTGKWIALSQTELILQAEQSFRKLLCMKSVALQFMALLSQACGMWVELLNNHS